MDLEFLENINPKFLCWTTAILCHALCCWQNGLSIDEIHLKCSNSQGKLRLVRVHEENPVIG